MLERLFALETFGIKLGLENIRRLCEALDYPQRAFTSLHVAGTNGKGSVTAMAHAALTAAGIKAGRYTSPHLVHLNERFVVGGTPVDEATLVDVATEVLDAAEQLQRTGVLPAPPTFFEATTAIAFEIFRRAGVEAAVIEVGLGGRFDATNVLDHPPVGAITSIAFDHQQQLGDTLAKIAFEKAGIIKPGMTIVCGGLPDDARDVIARIAADRGASLIDATADTRVDYTMEAGRAELAIDTPTTAYRAVRLGLRGEHQVGNAVVAVRLLESAREHGLAIPQKAIEDGLARVEWPARLEEITAMGARVLLDAAHNEEGARALRHYLARWHRDRPLLVVSVMRDKDADAILGELLPVTSSVVATAAATARAMPAHELASRVKALDASRSVVVCADVGDAMRQALAAGQTVCVAGSIFLVGAVRDQLLASGARRAKADEPDILR